MAHGWLRAVAPREIFFVVAIIAAVLGQRGVAGLSAQIGYLFVGVAVLFLLVALLSGRGPAVVP
jgi:uncharacterized membrane protein YtjA (UPF0391 family)